MKRLEVLDERAESHRAKLAGVVPRFICSCLDFSAHLEQIETEMKERNERLIVLRGGRDG